MHLQSYWFADNFGWVMLIGMSLSVVIGCVINYLSDRNIEIKHAKHKSEENTGSVDSWRMFLK